MNNKKIIKVVDIIALISIAALVYGGLISLCVDVFNLKNFSRLDLIIVRLVDTITYLLIGVFIVNIMFNLSAIRENTESQRVETVVGKGKSKWFFAFLGMIPLIIIVLLVGNYISVKRTEKQYKLLVVNLAETYSNELADIGNYSFNQEWIDKTSEFVSLFSKIDRNIASTSIIVKDKLNGSDVFLSFGRKNYFSDGFVIKDGGGANKEQDQKTEDNIKDLNKNDYLYSSTMKEREYLNKVFTSNFKEIYLVSEGKHKLFIPVGEGDRSIVLLVVIYSNY